MGNSKSRDNGVQPSSSGSHRAGDNIPKNAKKAKQRAAPAVVQDASQYALQVTADTQFEQYTYGEDVKDFFTQIVIEAPHFEAVNRPSVDLIAVLDVSGSMSGNKISLVRKSMRRLIRAMGNNDRVAFVTFDTNVRVVMDFCNMNEQNKDRALDIVGKLREGSSTNLCGGVTTGVDLLMKNRVNELASVLLFTDGQANVGISDPQGIVDEVLKISGHNNSPSNPEEWTVSDVASWLRRVELERYAGTFESNSVDGSILMHDITEEDLKVELGISKLHVKKIMREVGKLRDDANEQREEGEEVQTAGGQQQSGFRLHTFGFGSNHNSHLLEELANSFDGMYYFMKDEDAIKSGFANCLGGLLSTVAQNIKLQIAFPPMLAKCHKVHKEWVNNDSQGREIVTFADLQSEEKRHVLISVDLPALQAAEENYVLFDVLCTYDNCIAGNQSTQVIQCVLNRSGLIDEFNEEIDISRNRLLTQEALKEAQRLGDQNNLSAAREKLQSVIDQIHSSATGSVPTCNNFKSDLRTAVDKFRDLHTFKNEGDIYCVQNHMCLMNERAVNFDYAEYATQSQWNTDNRVQMADQWEMRDMLDSCEAMRYSNSPPRGNYFNRDSLSRSNSLPDILYSSDDDDILLNMLQQDAQQQQIAVPPSRSGTPIVLFRRQAEEMNRERPIEAQSPEDMLQPLPKSSDKVNWDSGEE